MINLVYEWRGSQKPLLDANWKRLELNLQSARWADDGQGRFVDQVRYLMRVFRKDATGLHVAPLENTPDVERLSRDPALKNELAAWLANPETVNSVERGFPQMPEKFAATVAESVTPFGLGRLANRPFAALFAGSDESEALLRRLDSLTCVGCHQTGAVAGFHFLGNTGPTDGPSLSEPFSPYFAFVQSWRASGEGPLPVFGVPHETPAPQKDGDACETATLFTSWHAEEDVRSEVKLASCPRGGVCASSTNGFPEGLCSARCENDKDEYACADVPTLGPFSVCREEGGSFAGCLARFHQRTAMAACESSSECRPDYACVSRPGLAKGYCVPAYVLPHLNIQHH